MAMADLRESDFLRENILGNGSYGIVFKAVWRSNGNQRVAIKEIVKSEVSLQELETVRRINHRNIVTCFGCYETANDRCLVFEFADIGDLDAYIRSFQGQAVPEERALGIALDIAKGLQCLHPTIIHRDIKSQNVLLFSNGENQIVAKICDFGFAKTYVNPTVMTELRGTVSFMAPEVARGGSEKRSLASDIWSYGCVLLHMVTAKMPFHEKDGVAPIIFALGDNKHPTIPEEYNGIFKQIIHTCFKEIPRERFTISEVIEELTMCSP